MTEYKIIPNHPDYILSSYGVVLSLKSGCPLKPDTSNGYRRIQLGKDRYYISHLVAELFIPNPLNLEKVIHKDGDRLNDAANNLKWGTAYQARSAAYKHRSIPR